jgi:DNA polymerase III subunit chi
MPSIQVDFYLLSEENRDALLNLACRLLEKAYLQNLKSWVWCKDKPEADALDLKLWTFKEDSFIPHAQNHETLAHPPLIQIATHYPPQTDAVLLLNLSSELVSPSASLTRILEIVPSTEHEKEVCRAHYRAYRDAGYKLNTHQLDH